MYYVSDWDYGKESNMGQGLQVWDENGGLQLDLSTRITTFIGSYTITSANPKITITDDIFITNTAFYARALMAQGDPNFTEPSIETQTGNKYTIEFNGLPSNSRFSIYVGAY